MKEIQSAAIVGMGALGMLYGGLILTNLGSGSIRFIASPERIRRYQSMEFSVNGTPRRFPLQESGACGPADLVIVAVKYNALPSALDDMARLVGPDTTIISVMNGITSEQTIGARYGMEKVVGCIAQGMDAVKFGGDLTYTKPGELRVGILPESQAALAAAPDARLAMLTRFLDRAGIAYTVEDDIRYRLWGKFMLNVGVNQTCMAFETNYGGVLAPGPAFDTFVGAMEEVIRLANLEGVPLTEADLNAYVDLIATLSPEGMPSMRQDGIAHRPTEVEMFAGTVRTLAAKHGLPVPVNDWLYGRIRELEAGY